MAPLNSASAAARDVIEGARLAPVWWRLGIDQTVARYRRTLLGPFWLASSTISVGLALSVVFGAIFGGNWRDSFPFVLAGVTAWGLVSGTVTEGSQAFLSGSGIIQVQKLPLSFFVYLQMDRLLINFAHQLVAFWLVTLVLRLFPIPHWQIILAVPVVLVTGVFVSIPIGMLSTRFRDINYFVGFIMSALFMLTPIFWRRAQLRPGVRWIADYNPLAHMLEIVRQPLLGHPAPLSDWVDSLSILLVSVIAGFVALMLFRRRVVFWL